MPRLTQLLLITLAAAFVATPAAAATRYAPSAMSHHAAFDVPAVTDQALAAVSGTPMPDRAFLRRAGRDDYGAYGRQTAQVATVTFDNWFNDVGAALIISNRLAELNR